jgi:hypothetical protein
MKTLVQLLTFIAAPIALLTAVLNLKTAANKCAAPPPLSDTAIAIMALVVICIALVIGVCYLVKR